VTGTARLTLAGAIATLLAAIGLFPLLADTSWVSMTVVAVGLVAGVGAGLRALRVPAWAVLAAQGLALVLWAGHLVASDVARLGFLPSRAWAGRLGETLLLGLESVRSYQAPVPVDDGILLLVVAGVGMTAWAVDALAVTARVASLTGLPLVIIYAVATVTSPTGPSGWAFVAAAAGYLGLLAVDGRLRAEQWGRPLGSATAPGSSSASRVSGLATAAWPLAIGAVAVSLAGAALLPEGGVALISGPGGSGNGDGQTIRTDNPIVDLKRDLVLPEDVEVIRFTSSASQPDYLRLLTLDVYDGTVWRTSDRPVPEENRVASGLPIPPGLSSEVARTEVTYQIEATANLESQWLPLPYPAQEVSTPAGDWRYHADTLDVVATDRSTAGLRYDVTALDVLPSAEQLAGPPPLPGDVEDLVSLPDSVPALVRDLAREVTADAGDTYERAVALQTWFRTEGGFEYDLDVDPGNGSDDLLAFLQERRGYCEQFAATMAIMARALGIPARVAVGYLRGEQQQPGFWVVRAQDAHAWPELFFANVGWVRFEPTPGSRSGAPPPYTVPGASDGQIPDSLQDPVDGAGAREESNRPVPRLDEQLIEAAGGRSGPSPLPVVVIGILLALLALGPLLAGLIVRRRRWSAAGDDPARQAEAAWADVTDTALEVGLEQPAHETIRSAAATLSAAADLPADVEARLATVAQATERARYAAQATPVSGLRADAAAVRTALVSRTSRSMRWRALLWPAPLRRMMRRRSMR
jgi:transglutaminase-like putative cysteine protease